MTKFDFTDEEIQLNKKGLLSEKQKQVLHAMAYSIRSSSKSGLWLVLFFLALGIGINGAVFLQGMDARRLQTLGLQMLAGWCFAIVAVLTIYSLSIFFSYRRAAKIEVAPVLSAEGIISHGSDYSPSAGFRSYYVYFGKKRFSFPNEMNRTFPEGSTFRIYYCKVGQIELIMSFERLS
jgi:hypothetical protein